MKPNSLFLSLLLVALLALVACGGQESPAPVPTAETVTEPTPAPEEPATTAPEPEPTETTVPASPTAVVEPEPETEAEPEATTVPPTPQADPNTSDSAPVSFEIPPSVAASATLTTVQNTADQTNIGQPYWAILPQHLRYNFDGYALSETFHDPRLIVYPAPEFADLNPAARETIGQLQTILADRPDLASEETLPLLPIFNAAQVFHAQAEYLDFGSGQGIRYLTQFDQAINPISNRTIFYTFQGLTNDGRHYVTAVLPIASPNLPDDGQLEQDAFEEFAANFESYIAETVANLNETDPASFTPPLGDLDSMVASVSVNLPAPPKRTNDSGQIVLTISRPTANAQLEIGQEQTINGYVAPGTTGTVEIALVSGVNTLISTTVTPDPTTGDWATSLTIPNIVNGRAQ
ncbi:MAG: hypothetical protein KDD89_15365, partial [Anaerolineales bacterium]|nr:hypothetical protein [Anaerolineales bacterium]